MVVTGHVISPKEQAEMVAELWREKQRQRGDEGQSEEHQEEELPSQPPPPIAKPKEGELENIKHNFSE